MSVVIVIVKERVPAAGPAAGLGAEAVVAAIEDSGRGPDSGSSSLWAFFVDCGVVVSHASQETVNQNEFEFLWSMMIETMGLSE